MKHLIRFPLVLLLLTLSFVVVAQNYQSTKGFVPNKGQLADTDGNLRPEIAYYTHGAMAWYFREDGWSIVLSKEEAPDEFALPKADELYVCVDDELVLAPKESNSQNEIPKILKHRIDVKLVDQSDCIAIIAKEPHSYYNNYYYGHCPEGITEVHPFKTITYKEAWPGIDIRFTLPDAGGVEYDFMVHPGANPKDIGLEYFGSELSVIAPCLPAGRRNADCLYRTGFGSSADEAIPKLEIPTPLGSIIETIPSVYGLEANNQKTKHPISAIYQIKKSKRLTENRKLTTFYPESIEGGNLQQSTVVSFKLSHYDPSQTLIIDPWATFIGGTNAEYLYGTDVDDLDNIIITGRTNSSNYPAVNTTNNTNNGGMDVIVARFDPYGNVEWSLYFGGQGSDEGHSVVTDPNNNIYVVGMTTAAGNPFNNFPSFANPGFNLQDPLAQDMEGFLFRVAPNGVADFSTFYGGGNYDVVSDIAYDPAGFIVLTGFTKSTDIPLTGIPHQNANPGGFYSSFIARFELTGALDWASYLGGSGTDVGKAITVDGTGAILVSGITTSDNNIALGGAYQMVRAGGYDFFLMKFIRTAPNYNLSWGTYYGGAEEESAASIISYNFRISTDANNDVFLGATTESAGLVPNGWNDIHSPYKGTDDYDNILAKFDGINSNLLAATYIGGNRNDGSDGTALAINLKGEVVMVSSCLGDGQNWPGVTKDAIKGPSPNYYVARFTKNLDTLICGSYLGVGRIQDMALDAQGQIIAVGYADNGWAESFQSFACPAPPNTIFQGAQTSLDGIVSKHCSPCGEVAKELLISNVTNDNIYPTSNSQSVCPTYKDPGRGCNLAATDTLELCKDEEISLCLGVAFGKTACYNEDSARTGTYWENAQLVDPLYFQWIDLSTGAVLNPLGPWPTYVKDMDKSCITFGSNAAGIRQFLVEAWYGSCAESKVITFKTNDFNLTPGITTLPSCASKGSGTVVVNSLGTAGPYEYVWISAAGDTVSETANAVDVLCAGENYDIYVTDALCGTRTANLAVAGISPPIIKREDSTQAICGATTGEYEISVSGGAGAPYTISWFDTTNTWVLDPALNNQTRVTLTCDIVYAVEADDGTCKDTIYILIPCTPAPIFSVDNITDATCDQDNGCVEVSIQNGSGVNSFDYSLFTDTSEPNWTLVAFDMDTDQTEKTFCNLAPGNYAIALSDSLCTDTLYFTIDSISVPTLSLQSSTKSNCTAATGALEAAISGGIAPFTYQWYTAPAIPVNKIPAATSLNLTGQQSGCYVLIVTDANGCKDSLEACIASQSTFTATLSKAAATCELANGTATITIDPEAGNYHYIWKDNANATIGADEDNIDGLSPGNYCVEIRDEDCDTTICFTIEDGGKLDAEITNVVNPACGANNGSACVQINQSIGNEITYLWNTTPPQATACATNLGAGVYTVTIKDSLCEQTLEVTLGDPGAVSGVIDTIIHTTCGETNGCATVHGVGGAGPPYTYSWLDANGNTAGVGTPSGDGSTLCNLDSGDYTVVIDDGICTYNLPIRINALPYPELQLVSVSPDACGLSNGKIVVTSTSGTGALSYEWYKLPYTGIPIPFEISDSLGNLESGCYRVYVQDDYCKDSLNICVPKWDRLAVSIIDSGDAYCGQNNGFIEAKATGGSGNYSYNWYEMPLATGLWIGNGSKVTNLPPDCYAVIAEDLNYGCFDTAYYCVLDSASPIITIASIIPSACNNDDGYACVSVSGGTGVYTYTWKSVIPHSTVGVDNNCLGPIAPGMYRVIVFDGNCYDSLDVIIPNDPKIQLSLVSKDAEYCEQDNGYIEVQAALGTGTYNYSWYDTLTGIPYATGTRIAELSTGKYCVSVYDGQCYDTLCTFVDSIPSPIIDSVQIVDAACEVDSGSAEVFASGGSSPLQYAWYLMPISPSNIGVGSSINGLAPGSYAVIVADSNCSDTAYFDIIMHPSPSLALTEKENASCNMANGSATLQVITGGTSPYSFTWNPNVTHTDSANQTWSDSLLAGTYCVTVTDSFSCTDSVCFTITDPGLMSLQMDSTADFCNESIGTAEVKVTGGTPPYSYLWNTGGGDITAKIIDQPAGNYNVAVTDANGCVQSNAVSILNYRNTITTNSYIDFMPDVPEARDSVYYQAYLENGWGPLEWFRVSPSESLDGAVNQTTVYYDTSRQDEVCLMVVDTNLCYDTLCVDLTIEPNVAIYIPNAFTPINKDTINATWRPKMVGVIELRGSIYDRWGKEIFVFNNITDRWNGKLANGDDAKQGIYAYVLNFVDRYGVLYERRGTVAIVH